MKKFSIIVLISMMCLFMFWNTVSAKEQTLDQLLAQAKANRDAYNKAKSQKALTESERAEAINQKAQVERDIAAINTQLKSIEKDVERLQKDIEKKDKEIKEIMKFVQVSNGESAYLEYAFGASSFTDFIYRVSVAEQLSDYNDELIKSYNRDIKNLEQKQKELLAKQTELTKKEQELSVLEAKLTKEIQTLQHGMISKDEEYKTQIALINSMKQRGCRGSETVTSCQNRINQSNYIPSTNGTYMPIAKGYVTSGYGYRNYGGGEFHTGVDFSASVKGDTIYPIAAGQVVLLRYNASCGNHMVYVKHNINGRSYITSYWHLRKWTVSVGQNVSAATKLGEMGGYDSADKCSGGTHVHLNLFNNSGNQWENRVANGGNPNSGRINPGTVMNIPAKGTYFRSPR